MKYHPLPFTKKQFKCIGIRNPINVFGRIDDLEAKFEALDKKIDERFDAFEKKIEINALYTITVLWLL